MKPLRVRPGLAMIVAAAAVLVAAGALAVAVVALASDSDTASTARTAALPSRSSTLGLSSLRSPDGRYAVTVTDAGIVLSGVGATLRLDAGGVKVEAPVVTVKGTARVDVVGTSVGVNSAGCRPVARTGDRVAVNAAPGVAPIVSGSATVCIGG